jgi:DNA-binding ferritin-like protein
MFLLRKILAFFFHFTHNIYVRIYIKNNIILHPGVANIGLENSDMQKISDILQKYLATEIALNLLKDTETIVQEMRKDIDTIEKMGNQGTEDFITALIQKHEKDGWMIRSLCKSK